MKEEKVIKESGSMEVKILATLVESDTHKCYEDLVEIDELIGRLETMKKGLGAKYVHIDNSSDFSVTLAGYRELVGKEIITDEIIYHEAKLIELNKRLKNQNVL